MAGGFFVFFGGMVLGGSEFFEKVFGAFAKVGESANAAGGPGETVGEDVFVDDDFGAGSAETIERFKKGGAGGRAGAGSRSCAPWLRLALREQRRRCPERGRQYRGG